jgi:nitroreductase
MSLSQEQTTAAVDSVIDSRYSCRAFLPTPVPEATLREILSIAARAPSGTNTQPWKVYVVSGEAKTDLSRRMRAAFDDPEEAATHKEPYEYYPKQWVSPYIDRRRKVGLDLYKLLGIAKGDGARMHEQHGRNYDFFGAPVGLILTIDKVMEQGSWFDYGAFLQNLLLAAKARGLDTCAQASIAQFHKILHERLAIPDNETVICGVALGHADTSAVENTLRTERAPLEEWVKFFA